uniref:Insecticidal crystal toxin domain-containing protein n=1 Tax=Leersia perrieri TaxID=77586 RepID=A0A0D9X7S5_9ORYZ
MYSTKPLSLFKSHSEAASQPPPDGRNSGYLVVKGPDDDGGDDETCCWGTCGGSRVRDLPFPQNRVLTLRYTEQHGESSTTYTDAVVFVPVPDLPLSSNRYYAVVATGKYKGLVRACSREEDMTTLCFCRCVNDVKPRPFDPADVYQQIEIVQRRRGRFTARSVAEDGFPYFLYRKKYWRVYASKPKHFDLAEAGGVNAALRSRQLGGGFPTAQTAVGKWYAPFFHVKESGVSAPEQMDRATFYEVSLEQRWEPVRGDIVGKMDGTRVLIGGSVEGRQEGGGERHGGNGYVWFRAAAAAIGGGERIGVAASLWERMRWEEYRGGWVDEQEEAGRFAAGGSVLVERFVVKRTDGSVAVAVDFVHFNKVREKQA